MVADISAPKQGLILYLLICLGSFHECWRPTNVTTIPKGAPSPDWENFRPRSITPFCLRDMKSKFLTSSEVFVKNKVHSCCLVLL